MNKNFYLRLGATNIKKNKKFYLPFLLTGVMTVTMFYIMASIAYNDSMPGGTNTRVVLYLGIFVIGIFGALFLFYTNNFLIKRRKKELGLYNVLGMEKKHIAKVLFHETAISAGISIIGGLIVGIAFSKLMFMLLMKLIKFQVYSEFQIGIIPIAITMIVFIAIYLLILIVNRIQISKSKPIDLMSSTNVGEKEPKVKWIPVVIGVVSLAAGYYMATGSKDTLTAIMLFFAAVILVIIGTYCLFMAGSIAVLKLLKKNKDYYYKKNHFVSVSGMIYRMKQNAKGLANICILSTMVLVTVSTTVSLYVGMGDVLDSRYPSDYELSLYDSPTVQQMYLKEDIKKTVEEQKLSIKDQYEFESMSMAVEIRDNEFSCTQTVGEGVSATALMFMTEETYTDLNGSTLGLKDGQVAVMSIKGELPDKFTIFDKEYSVVKTLDEEPAQGALDAVMNASYIIVKDQKTLDDIYQSQKDVYGDEAYTMDYRVRTDVSGTDAEKLECYNKIIENTSMDNRLESYGFACRQEHSSTLYEAFGGFLFLGIFMGVLFLMATVLIIYYKQIMEGYEDRTRFVIMKNVGMDEKLIKGSIRNQVLTMFLLPIITAAIHLAFAFPMLKLIMAGFGLVNTALFATYTAVTVGVFALIYFVVFRLTARTYYNIVNGK